MPAKDQPPWILDQRRALGDRIAALRLHRGLTQDDAVERTGIPRSTYQRIERGQSDVRFSQLLLIAEALEVHVAELHHPHP
ncbi:helix-turn-helix domain-containing protein [Streptomyces phaeochromogenes]|uniref:helix-turn-helix domain-containing protein n=1 Tax=Streptomyces phaeochromogenes TaxID=1923 RepID=UPI0036B61649